MHSIKVPPSKEDIHSFVQAYERLAKFEAITRQSGKDREFTAEDLRTLGPAAQRTLDWLKWQLM